MTGLERSYINYARKRKEWFVAWGNTASLPIAPALIEETRLDFQRKIKLLKEQFNTPDELILNFDQTPLAYICAPNHTLEV